MANWWRITVEQGEYQHWFEVHPSRMNKVDKWIDSMVKKYPQIKFHLNQELYFDATYTIEWDSEYNLIKLSQTNYIDKSQYEFEYDSTDIFYFKEFPDKEISLRKIKLQKINEKCL